jgi:hypothetical protein
MRGDNKKWFRLGTVAALALAAWGAQADEYCCTCKGKPGKTISAGDELTAGAQCSIQCKRPTIAKAGACESGAAPAATSAAKGSSVALFASDDCSGDATRISGSSATVAAGMRSYMVESDGSASAWQKANYAGAQVQPVGGGSCISPGWEIGSVRFGEK